MSTRSKKDEGEAAQLEEFTSMHEQSNRKGKPDARKRAGALVLRRRDLNEKET